jgi:hypothetical protein
VAAQQESQVELSPVLPTVELATVVANPAISSQVQAAEVITPAVEEAI